MKKVESSITNATKNPHSAEKQKQVNEVEGSRTNATTNPHNAEKEKQVKKVAEGNTQLAQFFNWKAKFDEAREYDLISKANGLVDFICGSPKFLKNPDVLWQMVEMLAYAKTIMLANHSVACERYNKELVKMYGPMKKQ